MNIKKIITVILLSCLSFTLFSQGGRGELLTGKVVDEQNNEPVPYAAVVVLDGGNTSVITGDDGEFSLNIRSFVPGKTKIKISSMGYKTEVQVLPREIKDIQIKLKNQPQQLKDVVVKKAKYRNKNNPAVELIKKVVANKDINRQQSIDYYQYEKYEKIMFALNNITPEFKKKKMFKHFQFVFDNTDTTKLDGKEILPLYLKENISDCYYQRDPKETKEIVKANKMVSVDKYVDNQGLAECLKYMYQDVDIYDNDVVFLTNSFLSPIASTAPTFYRFYILDTVKVGEDKCVKMFFGSRNKEDLLFQGYLYVMLDGSYAIRKIDLSVNKNINLNFVKSVKIAQEYQKTPTKGWIKSSEETSIDFGLTAKSRGLFGQRTVSYKKFNFDPPSDKKIFSGPGVVTLDSANTHNENYWDANRHEKLSKSEAGTYTVMDSIQKVPVFKHAMDILTLLLFGYKDCGYFEIGPVNTFYSYNPVEGVRLRFGGRTTPRFSKRLNFETYAAYGFKDDLPKYYLGATWSFTKKSIYEFPVKSLLVSYQNDTKIPGQDLQFVQEDNILLSIKRGVNDKLFYNKTIKIEHLNEFDNHFSYKVGYLFNRQTPGGSLYFNNDSADLSHTNTVDHLNISEFSLDLRYAPNEKFYQTKLYRVPIQTAQPVIELQCTLGSKLWGNDYNYQNLKFSITKSFYWSIFGITDVVWESGKIFGKVPYPLLDLPRANQTYSYQILSYNLMNFMEFVGDEYTSLNVDHCFYGLLFNKIPLFNRLKWREVMSCKVLYGDLSKNNNPEYNTSLYKLPTENDGTVITHPLGGTPYIEGSVGITNIFKFFRVDLVRRFTYLDYAHVSPWGIRARFRFDF
ncbi:MAG: DUF5686 family protein [Paludibacteraceae bacterium]|nr:DUF5686 family protein [Paludibacteraceae bacterium]